MSGHLMNTYRPLPVAFTHGEGAWLYDRDGRRYLDALAGIAVCGLGHAHPAVTEAICDQAGRLLHSSNLYHIGAQEDLATRLCALSGMDRAFFANSGAEANEAALKLARLYGHGKGIDAPQVVVMEGSFHGRTLATLTATGNRRIQAGFEPLVPGFLRAPWNDIEALENIAANRQDVVAVLVEPVTGEGGVRIPNHDYLPRIRALCDEHGWLLMLDEIQTGVGRTGRWFAFQHTSVQPDVMTLAKALGNGVPVGACLARGPAAGTFQPGNHGSTFGGNPLASRAALAVIDTLETQGLVPRAETLGNRLLETLRESLASVDGVHDIRGRGLMIGIELERPCGVLVERALERGLLINVTADTVLRLLPPLILSDEQADQLIDTLVPLVTDFLGGDT
ncbi:MAG TPA: aspartate aminotransferase family protein [Gammaproteobacteria bacterium]|nr:aspartate aminotransferase family protein [Gammaproteobacteria bacterium]